MRNYIVCLLLLLLSCSDETVIAEEHSTPQKEYGQYIIAHRGCWDMNANAPTNSKTAFVRALDLNIYGTEFDVRQTKDGKLVINHDATFHGLIISQVTYHELCQFTLSNGEPIPLLEDFLRVKCESDSKVKLIVELKNCKVNDVVLLINQYQLQDQVEFISFSKSYCLQLKEKGFGNKTYYLGGDISLQEIKELGLGGIDFNYSVLKQHPEYIEEAKFLSLKVFTWTVNDVEMIKSFIDKDIIVTTDYPALFN